MLSPKVGTAFSQEVELLSQNVHPARAEIYSKYAACEALGSLRCPCELKRRNNSQSSEGVKTGRNGPVSGLSPGKENLKLPCNPEVLLLRIIQGKIKSCSHTTGTCRLQLLALVFAWLLFV